MRILIILKVTIITISHRLLMKRQGEIFKLVEKEGLVRRVKLLLIVNIKDEVCSFRDKRNYLRLCGNRDNRNEILKVVH